MASKGSMLRLPDIIDIIAREGQCLKWDQIQQWYEVLDGPHFEEKFNTLRCVRGKRKEDAVDRPFARMHIHFTLARGDKWAGTGSAFRKKHESSVSVPTTPKSFISGTHQIDNENSSTIAFGSGYIQNHGSEILCNSERNLVPLKPTYGSSDCMSTSQSYSNPFPCPGEDLDCKLESREMDNDMPGMDSPDFCADMETEDGFGGKASVTRLPDLIARLAQEGQLLRWDPARAWYEVIDGPAFEARFNALRLKRGKRREEAQPRPFARMHMHFVLVRGDKWAGTGSAFRPKAAGPGLG
eukprot:CAMPEP_0113663924 /NCGR_PEP_ID=MMETSP0038_2-20120614/1435_1 /TAXON_ID=2898 /ORGANISM="Cryptomonas paramecium" /LENGTH=296 /DNA_ID=CAMNT_0000579051 /DNA_START=146 /DNA_END=1033 /DNA_ORIENTATION=- /assembly_acc=CAM_ASM_000170